MLKSYFSKTRLLYAGMVLLSIIIGLLSRRSDGIPLWIGSAFWGLMIYFIVRFLSVNWRIAKVAAITLLFCYAIELSQLYQAAWINAIRATTPGHLVLGQGFEWGDLIAYTVGIMLGCAFDRIKRIKT
ncbi:DUF2809 domain-containing protein [Mucilaginibacter sp. Bleaf8]|uniref:ribosomal maturation YjgA family protein n=1 Tax=Mucilaginibacter sp. Bleaf8 TaxID=2834430 RepID=UPI001BD025AA|nr:DUF2809 domain-containing protein [Mucilaginibacter sp. Bleaf8]MBS7566900.1 DUF2809 domain-containing protein [Mucilaginibacter sp. Bleaf8]